MQRYKSHSISPVAKTFNHKMRSFRTLLCSHCTVFTVRLQCIMKKAWSSFFKISTDKLFCNLKSGKINYCFGKKVGKKSWILDPNICAKPVFKTFGIHHCCFGDISFQERKIICSSATASQTDNTLPFIIIFYDDVLFSWIILLQCNFPFLFLFCRMMPIT